MNILKKWSKTYKHVDFGKLEKFPKTYKIVWTNMFLKKKSKKKYL